MLKEFDPVKLSLEENQYLKARLGLPPIVALRDRPEQVTDAAVRPVIEGVYELQELEKHGYDGQPFQWVGIEAMKKAIDVYLEQAAKWARNKGRKGAPRFPSMCSFDGRGRAFLGGPGSDSGQVRTYFDSEGTRVPFAINLVYEDVEAWHPDWITQKPVTRPDLKLKVDEDLHRVECFCGHTEQFKEGSRASYSIARGRMSKHLRRATDNPDDHRSLHLAEFD